MSVLVLRADFEQAGRQRFINVCYDLADQSERIFDLHPDIRDSERALMKSPHRTALEKLNDLVFRVPMKYRSANPDRWERFNALQAGVVAHEMVAQVRDWLGVYDSFGKASIGADDIGEFPRLNVRDAVTPAVYDRMMDGMHMSSHVIYALGTGNRAFIMAKNRMRYLSGQHALSITP